MTFKKDLLTKKFFSKINVFNYAEGFYENTRRGVPYLLHFSSCSSKDFHSNLKTGLGVNACQYLSLKTDLRD